MRAGLPEYAGLFYLILNFLCLLLANLKEMSSNPDPASCFFGFNQRGVIYRIQQTCLLLFRLLMKLLIQC